MRGLLVTSLFAICLGAQGQNASAPASTKPQQSESASSSTAKPQPQQKNSLEPPHSDRVNADSLDDSGDSSSKNTQIDVSPPADDTSQHPQSSDVLTDEGTSGGGDTTEFHAWDPHKAAKDIEFGDYYFKRKNYSGAESRYREALYYKQNDAVATFRLAESLEKLNRPEEARAEYENYLKILPYGPLAPDAKKAIDRLNTPTPVAAKPAK
jgi:tetratricopeptide (TPR) repeat protein